VQLIPIYIFNYGKGDYEGLNNFLCSIDFSACLSSTDVEFIWPYIKSTLHETMSNFIPKIKLCNSSQPKYFTPAIKHQITCIRSLKHKFHRSPTSNNKNRLQVTEESLSTTILKAKSEYESKLIHKFVYTNNAIYRKC